MKNISFDNPYLLLVAIPAALLLLLPFLFAFRKENRSKSAVASFVIHLLIVALVSLAAAGTMATTVMTETEVYIVADASHSAEKNAEKIDGFVQEIADGLPRNSEVGLVCFGRDCQLLTPLGEELVSVSAATVDDSATAISDALKYTADLFSEDVIKRIVLITDGKETASNPQGALVQAVESLYAKDIYIDVIYVDSNISDTAREVQISDVDFDSSTYLNHESTVKVLVQSSYENKATALLYHGTEEVDRQSVTLTKGYTIVNFDLLTVASDEYDYRVEIQAAEDESSHNNAYCFTQSVTGSLKVLLVTSTQEDVDRAVALYGEDALIDIFGVGAPVQLPPDGTEGRTEDGPEDETADEKTRHQVRETLPCTVEELCQYDEILLSSVDVRELENSLAFIDAVEKAVSLFGKSLVTMGDLQIQNKTDEELTRLGSILPVNFGNNDGAPKLYTILIDISHSMNNASRLIMAKEAAKQLLTLVGKNDKVMLVTFAGKACFIHAPTSAAYIDEIKETIDKALLPEQGTYVGNALNETEKKLADYTAYKEKQVVLISDGMTYLQEPLSAVDIVRSMKKAGIYTSVINPNCSEGEQALKNIATAGGGSYYRLEDEASLGDLIFADVADDLTETVVEEPSPVYIADNGNEAVSGVMQLPNVNGYVYASTKTGAATVLKGIYKNAEGAERTPTLYATWSYGNGRVSTFTSALTGDWTADWQEASGKRFFTNVVSANTPDERVDHPYTVTVEYDGISSHVEIVPAVLNPYATADATVTLPDGTEITERMVFDSTKYFYSFDTPALGKYRITIVYSYGERSYASETVFNLSYSPEYDSFAIFDSSTLFAAVRNRGTVSEGEVPAIVNDEKEVATYTVSFTVPFMIAAVVLFVLDIIVRKIKWNDIKTLFGRRKRKGGNGI